MTGKSQDREAVITEPSDDGFSFIFLLGRHFRDSRGTRGLFPVEHQ